MQFTDWRSRMLALARAKAVPARKAIGERQIMANRGCRYYDDLLNYRGREQGEGIGMDKCSRSPGRFLYLERTGPSDAVPDRRN